jgi:transcriptional regulator with XRE-family HTH domain
MFHVAKHETYTMTDFGNYIQTLRESLRVKDPSYSLRGVAKRAGISPAFLSRLETGKESSMPSEEKIIRLAQELREDPDVLLAMAGKVSERLLVIIRRYPREFAILIQRLKEASGEAILKIAEVRDGNW